MNFLKKIMGFLVLVLVLVPAISGCVALPYLAIGAAGVVGGYVVSPDTVEGQNAKSLEETYDAVKEITGIMGQIVQESPNNSQLIAMISGTKVIVTLTAINVSTTKLSVKARKSFMPKIDIAQDVYTKIVNSMEK